MKIRIKFSKQGTMKFIGHLDSMRYFQKAMRRADVDIRYSEGFSPHQIMSFAAPLGVGLTGSGEYLDIEVHSSDSSRVMVKRLNEVMAEGVEILSFRRLPDGAANAMSLVAACDYTVRLREGYDNCGFWRDFFPGLNDFIQNGNLEIVKKTKKGEKQMDLRPFVYEYRLLEDRGMFLKLSAGSSVNIKPELLLEAYCLAKGQEYQPFAFLINREEVYADTGSEGSHQFTKLEAFGEEIE
ncbi:MAG: DUF2344 domain-containing protein [Lachnospiraceae bacterium]|nr:DUF2344 domain-containing protein [Lachnospiraceae bacterium]NBJ80427.1 DUF2344 domain-containing protein [bacterium 1XD42-76]NBK03636.1 DUF2344 domain-containing protein [bacterium 1XD42-94]